MEGSKRENFISITMHYIVESGMKSRVASVKQFNEDKKSGINIRQALEIAFLDLGFESEMMSKNMFFVTDQGSNIRLALSNYQRIPCACHIIATILRHLLQLDHLSCTTLAMDSDSTGMLHVTAIRRTVTAIKELTTYMRRSRSNLTAALKQSNETRWNSLFIMLESYIKLKDEVECVLKERGQLQRLVAIDNSIVMTLIAFLQPFKEATEYVEGDAYPTIHRVIMWKEKLLRCMTACPTDSGLLKFLKSRGIRCISEKFEISSIHMIALFLNPKFKSLVALPDRRDKIHSETKALLNEFFPSIERVPTNDHTYVLGQVEATHKSIDDEFLDWQQSSETKQYDDNAETHCVADFENLKKYFDEIDEFNILSFCENKVF